MTKDSICKDCVSQRFGVYEENGRKHVEVSCKKNAMAADASGNIKVLVCSEFEEIQKGGQRRFHTIQ